jgi:hypothetical protein
MQVLANALGGQNNPLDMARRHRYEQERKADLQAFLAQQASKSAHPKLARLEARKREPAASITSAIPSVYHVAKIEFDNPPTRQEAVSSGVGNGPFMSDRPALPQIQHATQYMPQAPPPQLFYNPAIDRPAIYQSHVNPAMPAPYMAAYVHFLM